MTPVKVLARMEELRSREFSNFMVRLNRFAREHRLQEYVTYSRIWEYPWLWSHLQSLSGQNLELLDIGTETSPFPWFLATQGFNVTVSDINRQFWDCWEYADRRLGSVSVHKRVLDTQDLAIFSASYDIYLSVSVLEHVPNKQKAIEEAARILRPGGLLIMTFDLCEDDLGMTFPAWNGRAISMKEFDELFPENGWFEPGVSALRWNTEDLPEYFEWHRGTAIHHNYITGAALFRRNEKSWPDNFRITAARGKLKDAGYSSLWKARNASFRFRKHIREKAEALFISTGFYSVLPSSRRSNLDGMKKSPEILVIRLDEIGDVVMTSPFLRELRRNYPGAFITVLVKPVLLNYIETCPYVDKVLTFDPGDGSPLSNFHLYKKAYGFARNVLSSAVYDAAFVPRFDADYYAASLLAYWSGASERFGFGENSSELKKITNKGYDRLFTEVLNDNAVKHEVQHALDLLRWRNLEVVDPHMETWPTLADISNASTLIGGGSGNFIAFGIGARAANRKWPEKNFLELARWLSSSLGARIFIVGGQEDMNVSQLMEEDCPAIKSLCGKTTLRETCAALKQCTLFIGNDSGPMHLAVASGVPVVMLSCHPQNGSPHHSSSPSRVGPWLCSRSVVLQPQGIDPCDVACGAPTPHCITQISVKDVQNAIGDIFERIRS